MAPMASRPEAVVYAALALVLAGCGGRTPAPVQPTAPAAAAASPPALPNAPPAPPALVDLVPASAVWAVVVRAGALAPLRQALDDQPELRSDLSIFLRATLGVDLTQVDGLVAFSLAAKSPPTGALLLHMTGPGVIGGPSIGAVGGVEVHRVGPGLTAAALPIGVVLGTERDVAAAIALSRHEAEAVGRGAPLGGLAEMPTAGIDIVAAAHAPSFAQPDLASLGRRYGLQLATLTFSQDGTLRAAVRGEARLLAELRDQIQAVLAAGVEERRRRKQDAMAEAMVAGSGHPSGSALIEGLGSILAHHLSGRAAAEVAPVVVGDELVARYQLPRFTGAASFVPYAAAAAAIGLPALGAYLRELRQGEAILALRRLRTSIIDWHAEHAHQGPRFAFPPTTPWSPAARCCTQRDQLCRPTPEAFAAAGWKALGFTVAEPHHFEYRLVSSGRGHKARFTLWARADLECDDSYTVLSLGGGIGPAGELELGDIDVVDNAE